MNREQVKEHAQTQRTPGPYRWMTGYEGEREVCDVRSFRSKGYYGNPELVGANEHPVISGGGGEYTPFRGETIEQAIENAVFIETALNAHDELVAALRKIQDDMAGFIRLANEVGINDADGFYLGAAMDAEKQARAALAKVK